MAAILCDEQIPGYLSQSAQETLATQRAEFGSALRNGCWHMLVEDESLLLWNFAGGAVNQTFKYGLELLLPSISVAPDNFKLKMRLGEVALPQLKEALAALSRPETWAELGPRLLKCMPNYRLSKFQSAMPEQYSLETVKAYLLDVETAIRMAQARFG